MENPKHYAGQAKIPFGDVPAIVMAELGVAMHEGARKYGAYNYRDVAIRASDYYDAVHRHLKQWWELGEDSDPTCGISHITKAIAALVVLRDAQINGLCKDDRPPAVNGEHWARLERVVQELRAKYPVEAQRVTKWSPDKNPTGPDQAWKEFHPKVADKTANIFERVNAHQVSISDIENGDYYGQGQVDGFGR